MSRARDRNRRRRFRRKENIREVRPRFLIVCEDGKSAPNYFRGFRLTSAQVIAVGAGLNTLQLVEEALSLRKKFDLAENKDQAWVVMDRNSFPQDDYDNAFHKANATGIFVAFGNECFEVWVHLHFEYSTAPIPRAKLPALLSAHLKTRYEKGMDNLYDLLLATQKEAIANSEKLLKHCKKTGESQVYNCCPSTNLQELVSELNRHL